SQRRQQEVRRRLPRQVQGLPVVLRRAVLRLGQPDQQRGGGGGRRSFQEGRHARRDAQGQLQVGARALQVRQQPLPDSELLPAGRGKGRRGQPDAQDGGNHRQGQPGQVPQSLLDEVVISGIRKSGVRDQD